MTRHLAVVAEIANAHEGSFEKLQALVAAAAAAECDFVKFQLFRADRLVAPDHPRWEPYHRLQFSEEQWLAIADFCRRQSIAMLAEVFDEPSLLISDRMKVQGYKIHNTCLLDHRLVRQVAERERLTLLSTGGSTLQEITDALARFHGPRRENVILMNGFQNFPTELSQVNLNAIQTLRQRFGTKVGLQDHVDGGTPFATIVGYMALAMGYDLVEKHLTLDRALKQTDYYSALNPGELRQFVRHLREAELMLGSGTLELSEQALQYRQYMKRRLFTAQPLSADQVLEESHLMYRRSPNPAGLFEDQRPLVVGKRLRRDLPAGNLITPEDLQP